MFIRHFIKILNIWGKLCFPLFLCANAFASNFYQDEEWQNLLHIRDKKTQLDSPSFFISEVGGKDPEAEFKASVAAISTQTVFGKLKLPFACAYPARYKYLSRKLNLETSTKCPGLDQWLEGLKPETLSIIFASYYPNNPASIFGHTFLKINSSSENKISDYAINYLAITSENNGLIFGLKGLFGAYQGQFSIMPYFLKVNEYNHSESRDLFEYHLNFNKDEIDTLLRHVWELENNGYFDYYFLDDNCSYFLMRILDVARPSLKLSQEFSVFVIPAETIKLIHGRGIVTNIEYRPSLYTQINNRIEHEKLNDIDTQIMLKQFQKQAQKRWSNNDENSYYELLSKRAKDDSPKRVFKLKPTSFPHETHSPAALGIGAGSLGENTFSRLSFRPGVHHLLESNAGYLPFSSVEVFQVSLRSFSTSHFFLDQFTLIEVATLNPHKSWNPKLSWKSKVEFKRFDQDYCDGCEVIRLQTGIGKSFELNSNNLLSLFLNGQLIKSDHLPESLNFGFIPEITYHASYSKFLTEASVGLINRLGKNEIFNSLKISQGIGFNLSKKNSLRLKAQYYIPLDNALPHRSEAMTELIHFF